MTPQKRRMVWNFSLAALSLLLTAGCHQSSSDSGNTSTAGNTQSIQQIQSNPNIPPQAKASIIHQMTSKSAPYSKPNSSPPH